MNTKNYAVVRPNYSTADLLICKGRALMTRPANDWSEKVPLECSVKKPQLDSIKYQRLCKATDPVVQMQE